MSSRWPFLPPRPDSIRHRLIFALDVETFAEAERLVQLLAKDVGVFKVGKQLFLHSGPEVVRMTRLARKAGMDGVVTSPLEIARIRRECGRGFLIVTPGVRPARRDTPAEPDDQKRIMTPEEAMRLGADYLVLGRPIRDARDPLAAVQEVVAEMARGFLLARAKPGMRG